jgi:pyruvate dehydrogenase E2 component (dihydrolipoamide acetyltransferase)
MQLEFRMPSLGADMEAGTLVKWLRKPGDEIRRGEAIAVVETQKGAIDIDFYQDGTLEELLIEPGSSVPVGTPLATFRVAGDVSEARPPPQQHAPQRETGDAAARAVEPTTELPVAGAAGQRVSPAARRLAAARGIDPAQVTGSGPGGAVTTRDIDRTGAHIAASGGGLAGVDAAEMRKAIGAAMAKSKREIPHYYLGHDIDLTAAVQWLTESNAARKPEQRLLMSALLLKASALALRRFEELNGFWQDGAYRASAAVHLGSAVSLRGGGLIAPAIHDTDQLPLNELMARLRDVVARARAGKLRSSEVADATATVSSLGERGVEVLYGVIYPPQVALIGFGRPVLRPWLAGERVAPRTVVTVTLAADHRASDGHRGALFLGELDRLLQDPESL